MYSSDCHGSLHLMTSCCEIVTEDKLLQPGGGDFKLRDSPFTVPFLAKNPKKRKMIADQSEGKNCC